MSAPLLALLHLCDSLFPVGGFAHSDGLESAVSGRLVRSSDDLGRWLDVCLEEAIGRSEGPAVVIAWSAFHQHEWDSLIALDAELTAMRPSSTARMASRSMGLRLLNTWHALHPDRRLHHALALVSMRTLGPTLPVAFAGACACAGIEQRHTVEGFAYTRLAATVSSAMRLIAIGQNEAHLLLSRVLARVPATVDQVMVRQAEPESFMPALDIAQMTHQYVHSRLFRS
jgi:urease accessory protein